VASISAGNCVMVADASSIRTTRHRRVLVDEFQQTRDQAISKSRSKPTRPFGPLFLFGTGDPERATDRDS